MICTGRVAKDAAKYSDGLCNAIIKGMIDEMYSKGILRRGEQGLHAVCDESEGGEAARELQKGCSGAYRDDITGQLLRDDLVMEARRK